MLCANLFFLVIICCIAVVAAADYTTIRLPNLSYDDPNVRYEIMEQIGKGGQGQVFAATKKDSGEHVAVKKVYCDRYGLQELASMILVQSKHVTKYREAFCWRQRLWIVMDRMPYSLSALIPMTLTERHIAYILKQLLLALQKLHDEGIMHRDLKPGNVLFDLRGRIVISDFGDAVPFVFGDSGTDIDNLTDVLKDGAGTVDWLPPEALRDDTAEDMRRDVWALGIIAYQLAHKQTPYADLSASDTRKAIGETAAPRLCRDISSNNIIGRGRDLRSDCVWSKEYRRFVSKCLQKNHTKRPTANQLLNHPFIQQASSQSEFVREVMLSDQMLELIINGL